ncbi:hypothetical protein [Rhizobium rhizogenes]|uniref:hypothetical protein n=1 Tax=Rhizobium rhizogenes TaxID=359 RepID=UPI0015718DB2|nr:hypothetical protein [Rhizobium rhizogenes]NTF98070.1 hypothetical protein [Rhizobium rhizogenes]
MTACDYRGTGRNGEPVVFRRFVNPVGNLYGAAEFPQLFAVDQSKQMNLDDFYTMMEETVPSETRDKIDRLLEKAKYLESIGLAAAYHQSELTWKRAIIQAWCHSRDMTVIMNALGYGKICTGIHDIEEFASAKHIKETASANTSDWYQRWCASLPDNAMINIGYLNPSLCASLCNWGADKFGAQDAMHAHRLSEHHEGSPDVAPDLVEHAVNFVVHHLPREHFGVRHLPLGDWDQLEAAIAHTPLMQTSTVEQAIARDAALILRALEFQGKVTPWQLLKF